MVFGSFHDFFIVPKKANVGGFEEVFPFVAERCSISVDVSSSLYGCDLKAHSWLGKIYVKHR